MSRESSMERRSRHDRRLLNDEFAAVVRATRAIEIEDVRQIVRGVVLWAEVFFRMGTRSGVLRADCGPSALSNRSFLFANAAETGGEGATDSVSAFTDGVAGEAAAVSSRTFRGRRFRRAAYPAADQRRILPYESGDGVDLVVREPELRHFGCRPNFGGVADPSMGSIPCGVSVGFFQVGADFLISCKRS